MRVPKPLKITSRSSAITNSFVQTIIPVVEATDEQRREALSILGMSADKLECAYCGQRTTDWDHLRPLVRNKRPTGFFHEVANLVPACGPCNQSKSGRAWREWMESNARGSPRTKGVADIAERIARLEAFERWGNLTERSLADLAPAALWDQHWAHHDAIQQLMRHAQTNADQLRAAIAKAIKADRRTKG